MESENDDFQEQNPFPAADFQISMLSFRGETLHETSIDCGVVPVSPSRT